jgi:hypothetical protein
MEGRMMIMRRGRRVRSRKERIMRKVGKEM